MTPADLTVLQADRWFGAMPAARQALLLRDARVRAAASGARLQANGGPPDGLKAVLAGEVRLVRGTPEGEESVAAILGPGAWFGGLSAVDGGPQTHDAVAFGPARVLHLSQPALEAVAAQDPVLWRDLALLIAGFHRASQTVVAQSLTQPILVRLARTLAGAARTGGSDTVRLRQEDLAAMIGVSRPTISKALKQLEVRGMIEIAYGAIFVRDAEILRALGRRDRA
ncbi:MAG: Crp/Fnr family transcriptional regulator [Phenylobacterium sp.]|uniref:Crp/Fnr family transcriptional regulator n=1 Tax=Phenylobacterium sp. TaxID=1871053 RepID=UPI003BB5F7C5